MELGGTAILGHWAPPTHSVCWHVCAHVGAPYRDNGFVPTPPPIGGGPYVPDKVPSLQATNGWENPATSLTRSAWRPAPVFSYTWPRWVLTVLSAMPRASATSGTPPTSTTASSTRSSIGVSRYALAIASGGEGRSSAALCTNRAAAAW